MKMIERLLNILIQKPLAFFQWCFSSPLNDKDHRSLLRLFYILSLFQISSWAQNVMVDSPTALSPMAYITNESPTFNWTTVINATSYEVQLMNDSETQMIWTQSDISGNSIAIPAAVSLNLGIVYHWRVRGVNLDGVSPWSNIQSFLIYNPALVPSPQEPFSYITNISPQFVWSPIASAQSYELMVTDESGSQIFNKINNISSNQAYLPSDTAQLNTNMVYHWKVKSVFSDGTSSLWSNPMGFLIKDQGSIPNTLDPSGYISESQPMFQWEQVANALSYDLQILDESETSILSQVNNIVGSNYTFDFILETNKSYHWRVRAHFSGGSSSAWSPSNSFLIFDSNLVPVTLSPSGYIDNSNTTLSWAFVDGASTYEIEIWDDSEVNRLLVYGGIKDSQFDWNQWLQYQLNFVYHWRVRSVNLNGEKSHWSEFRSFAVTEEIPKYNILTLGASEKFVSHHRTLKLRWEPIKNSAEKLSYFVEVFDSTNETTSVFSGYAKRDNRIKIPKSESMKFSGSSFLWRVRAVNQKGQVVGSSDLTALNFKQKKKNKHNKSNKKRQRKSH